MLEFMSAVIVFDVNETLLDLSALDPEFEQVFGDKRFRKQWFRQMLQASMVMSLTGRYTDFAELGRAALDVLAARQKIEVSAAARQRIFDCLAQIPPFPDVPKGLEKLRAADLRLAVLTNSPPKTVEPQLARTGIAPFFEHVLTVDAVRRFKPASEPYRMALSELAAQPSELWMVAAHDWDLAGARQAGCRTAWLQRPGKTWFPLFDKPDLSSRKLDTLAGRLIAACR